MRLLNKIYGLVQAGRCLLNIFYADKFEQPEANPRLFCKFGDGKVEMVAIVHVNDTLAHAQASIKRFAAEVGGIYKVKSIVEKFGVEQAMRTPYFSRVPTLSPSG